MTAGKTTAVEAGARLYEQLRQDIIGDGPLSMDRFRATLSRFPTPVGEQFEGEVVVGAMFAACLAIEEAGSAGMVEELRRGVEEEFIRHLREQGAEATHVDEWRTILGEHFAEYFRSMDGHTGPALPSALGREFLWNITGVEEDDAGAIDAATTYLAAARAVARRTLHTLLQQVRT